MDDVYDVCIVGAGASGMNALKQLHEHNNDYRVCIIEGRDRIGIKILLSMSFLIQNTI